MNFKYVLPILILAFYSCNEAVEKKSFEISGVLSDNFQGYIYLTYGNSIDSVLVTENTFQFEGKVNKVEEGRLSLKRGGKQAHLYLENTFIDLTAEYDYRDYSNEGKFPYITIKEIEGTHSAKIQKEYYNFYQQNQDKDNFQDLLYNKLDSIISANNDHPFSGGILAGNAVLSPILSKKQFLNLYSKLDTTKQSKSNLDLFKRAIDNMEKYPKGKQFLAFSLPNKNNEMVDVDNEYGKITLIDFWASWCGPCRKTNPKYVALKKKLKSSDFDILGISIDSNREDWLKAIDKDKLEWMNLIDQKQEVYDELDVIVVPYSYLVDENGIILEINPEIQEIEKIVRKKSNK